MPLNRKINRDLFVLTIMTAMFYAAAVAFNVVSPLTYMYLPTDDRGVGLPIAIFMIANTLSAYPAGWLMDKVGRRPVLQVGFAVGATGFCGAAVALKLGSIWLYLLSIFAIGLSSGVLFLIRLVAAEHFPRGKEGKAVGVVLMGAVVAGVVAPLLFGSFETVSPLKGDHLLRAWLYSSLILAAGFIASFVLRRRASMTPSQASPALGAEGRVRGVVFMVACGSASHALMVAMMSLCSVLMIDSAAPVHTIYQAIGFHFVGMFGFAFFWGTLIDKVGFLVPLLVGWVVLVFSSVLLILAHSAHLYMLIMFFMGVGWSLAFIAITVKIAREAPASLRGRYMGLHDVWASGLAAGLSLLFGFLIRSSAMNVTASLILVLAAPATIMIFLEIRKTGLFASSIAVGPAPPPADTIGE